LGNSRSEPLLKHLINECRASVGSQTPLSLLCAYGERGSAQHVDSQRGGIRPSSAGPALMIIERCQ
jgi:hypothetical protein